MSGLVSISESEISITQYTFNKDIIDIIENNPWVRDSWPLIYIIYNDKLREIYIGESSNALLRITSHLLNNKKRRLDQILIIGCNKFNKSATLNIETKLIEYFSSDGKYKLQNEKLGSLLHQYHNKEEYLKVFTRIWSELKQRNVANNNIREINNSDLFNFSPYKCLSRDQYTAVQTIILNLISNTPQPFFAIGAAGTGKTILCIFLIKLLVTSYEELFGEYTVDTFKEQDLILKLKEKYPNPKVALVIPVASLRQTLQRVFRNNKGLKANMVIGPSDINKKNYDILLVDEAHRLKRRINLTGYGNFDINNNALGLGREGSQLNWVLMQSERQVFFYDPLQRVTPSDVEEVDFDNVLATATKIELVSQFRVKGGPDYVKYVSRLLDVKFNSKRKFFKHKNYEFLLFESLESLKKRLDKMEVLQGKCRLIGGYSWKWKSKNSNSSDINIGGLALKWNSTVNGWINSKNAAEEVGCIHTTQGYDINYAGVIFGEEIDYNPIDNRIVISREKFHDIKVKAGITDLEELKKYIINTYRSLMFRGVYGTYVYVCNENLREYFKRHISMFIS